MSSEQGAGSWQDHFQDAGALWQHPGGDAPHVATASGVHTDAYFNSDLVTANPDTLEDIVSTVLKPALEEESHQPDWVVSYAPYGILVTYACARQVGAYQGYIKPGAGYKTDFDIPPKSRVLVVADDIYSGDGVVKTITAMEDRGANVLPLVFCLANLSGESRLQDRRIVAAAHIPASLYAAADCLMCQQGSEPVEARPNWARLLDWRGSF